MFIFRQFLFITGAFWRLPFCAVLDCATVNSYWSSHPNEVETAKMKGATLVTVGRTILVNKSHTRLKPRSKDENGFFRKLMSDNQQRDYNCYVSQVDRSDQHIGSYNSLHKSNSFWKTRKDVIAGKGLYSSNGPELKPVVLKMLQETRKDLNSSSLVWTKLA